VILRKRKPLNESLVTASLRLAANGVTQLRSLHELFSSLFLLHRLLKVVFEWVL
jgi:hypothetical protein